MEVDFMIMKRDILRATLREDEDFGNGELLEENEAGFLYYDNYYGKEIQFTLQENMSTEWLAKKIYINPKVKHKYGLNEKEVARLLLRNLPSEHFITLNRIFIVYRKSDYTEIAKRLCDNKKEEIGTDLADFFDNQVGLMGFADNSVFINMRIIEKTTREVFEDVPYRIFKETIHGFWCTIFHEIRHLMLETNMFLDEDEYPEHLSLEENVEEFGNLTAENMKYQ